MDYIGIYALIRDIYLGHALISFYQHNKEINDWIKILKPNVCSMYF